MIGWSCPIEMDGPFLGNNCIFYPCTDFIFLFKCLAIGMIGL